MIGGALGLEQLKICGLTPKICGILVSGAVPYRLRGTLRPMSLLLEW